MPRQQSEIDLLATVPLVDPKTGLITTRWVRAMNRIVQAVQVGSAGTVWSTVNGIVDWRSLAALLLVGMVRQVVVGTTATPAVNATNVYAGTGLSVSITPTDADHQVLAIVLQNGCRKDTGDTAVGLKLRRGITDLALLSAGAGRTGAAGTSDIGTIAGAYLDTPGVTTPVTYDTQFASLSNVANARVQTNNELSTLVLVEIVA